MEGKKIKVIQFISSLHNGGAESLVKDYACMLNKEQFDVVVMTTSFRTGSSNEKALDDKGVKTYYIGNKMSGKNIVLKAVGALKRYVEIYKIIKKLQPDIIHCHLGTINFIAKFCRVIKPKYKLFFTSHCDWERQLSMRGIKKSVDYLAKKRNLNFGALHQQMFQQIKQKYPVSAIEILNNGTDLSRFEDSEKLKQIVRREEGISQNAFVVGHIGRFVDVKNHSFLIDIFEQMLKIKPDSILLLVGDGPLKNKIEEKVKTLGIETNVRFLGLRSDIPHLLSAMDVFCLPSITEGVPVTAVEAQAAGVKCVISDSIVDDVMLTDHIFKVSLNSSVQEWCRVICEDLKNDFICNSLQNFDMKNILSKLSRFYMEVLNDN